MAAPVTVIFSTYNSPRWLEKVLWGFSVQTFKDFQIVVADDGSTAETAETLQALIAETGLNVTHVWQPDDGFQKTRILNKAILKADGEYLIFTDGDCIPRADFVETHMANARRGSFLSGGYFKLPETTSERIAKADIVSGNCFDVDWLTRNGLKPTYKTAKLTATGFKRRLFNALTPTGATWNGHNASGWRSDIVAANGFDNRMQYGGEDRELGERLVNAGIKGKQIRYSAVVVHLHHSRSYISESALAKNRAIRNTTRRTRRTRTDHGIEQLDLAPAASEMAAASL